MVGKIHGEGAGPRREAGEIHPALPEYVINYSLGEDMVRKYIEKRAGSDPEKKWSEFGKLLASPRLPSGLR